MLGQKKQEDLPGSGRPAANISRTQSLLSQPPVSRYLDDGHTLEVNRLCTDGTKNACSFLYAAAWRAARAMGYRKIVTYILDTESGASLR